MKRSFMVVCATLALSIAGCGKKQDADAGSATADTQSIKITQASPPPGGTWADVVNETAAGAVMGNPNAKIKLIEIGSLSCPHCKAFSEEGVPKLVDKYIKSGNLSWEFRPYIIHGAIDMASNLAVRCNGVKTFFPMVEGMYKDQDKFLTKMQAVPQAEVERVQNLPPNRVFIEMAKMVGLPEWAAARGIPQQKIEQCLTNEQMIDHEVQLTSDVTSQFPDFQGTPTFVINGEMVKDVASWDKLEPKLEEAMK
jgi:protein-disulfide isomerase